MPKTGVSTFTNPTTPWGAAHLLNPDGATALMASLGYNAFVASLRTAANLSAWLALAAGSGPIQFGTAAAIKSTDPQIVVCRLVDNAIAGNGHCFSDSSDINRPGGIGYNSYDARVGFLGAENYDHYAAFQADPEYASAGLIASLYGLYTRCRHNGGSITNYYGVFAANPTGTGTPANCYGIYVEGHTKGAANWGVFVANNKSLLNATAAGAESIPLTLKNNSVTDGTAVSLCFRANTSDLIETGKISSVRNGSSDHSMDVSTYGATGLILGGRFDADGNFRTGKKLFVNFGGIATPTAFGYLVIAKDGRVTIEANDTGRLMVGADGKVRANVVTPSLEVGVGLTTPEGWWKCDDDAASTDVLDSSGSSYTLTAQANTSTKTAAGIIGTALTFDGLADYAKRAAATFTDVSGSISLWCKPAAIAGSQYLFCSADEASTTRLLGIGISSTGKIFYAQQNADTMDNANGDESAVAGQWSHVVVTSDGSTIAVYLNGVLQTLTWASGANNGDWFGDVANRDNIVLGAKITTSVGSRFGGVLDDVRVYTQTLTPAQVAYLYFNRVADQAGAMTIDGLAVTIGANDSGGAGYRVLRVPN